MQSSIDALKKDKRFARLIKKHGVPDSSRPSTMLRVNKNPFQSLVRSIVHQQVSGKAAATILQRFTELFPGKKFPAPEAVRKMPIAKMRAAGLSGQKASYIHDLAQKFADGTIKHRSLKKMPSAEVVAHLTQVKGIGVWTVHMFLINTLGHPDILPTGDLGIRKGFQVVYGLKELPGHDEMERLAKPWRAHASTASWYLWRAADEVSGRNRPCNLPPRDTSRLRSSAVPTDQYPPQ